MQVASWCNPQHQAATEKDSTEIPQHNTDLKTQPQPRPEWWPRTPAESTSSTQSQIAPQRPRARMNLLEST